jgi:hypothetical protein
MGTNAELATELAAWIKDMASSWVRVDRREKAYEIAALLEARAERAKRQEWEYMDLCPDSSGGYAAMLHAGEEGWEAACSWVERFDGRHINHILYKRPV